MMRIGQLVISAVLTICLSSMAWATEIITDIGKPIQVRRDNRVITLQLPANQTTGYQWYLVSDDSPYIKVLRYHYMPPAAHLIGAPGYAQFTVEILPKAFVVPRQLRLHFIYQRSWEPKPVKHRTIILIPQTAAPTTVNIAKLG